jgi:hypothetical protein
MGMGGLPCYECGGMYENGGELEMMREGGIPDRYKNKGFTKVGAKRNSTRPGKKWMVLAKKGDNYKVVHGGYDGMKDFTQHGSENRKERFWDRMGGRNSAKAKDPFSPLYWHKRFGTWKEGGQTGWLKKYQGDTDGSTVDVDPYRKQNVYRGPLEFKECQGEGCSKQATKGVASLYGINYDQLAPQDAWYKRARVIKEGGKEIYNRKSGTIDNYYNSFKVGDFVSLDRPGSPHAKDKSKLEGYTLDDNETTEHLGYVIGFDDKGVPLIKHGHAGDFSTARSYVQPITDLSLPDLGLNYKVSSIYRPKPLMEDRNIIDAKYYKQLEDVKNLGFEEDAKITKDKKKFIAAYNKNSKNFQLESGLSADEVAAIGNIAYGIFGNESKFNESYKAGPKQLVAETLYQLGLKDSAPSLGPTQIKYDDLVKNADGTKTKKGKLMDSLKVKEDNIDNVFPKTNYNAVTSATFANLAENYKALKTDPRYEYNPETNTVFGNVPIGVALAKSWQNPSLNNMKETLQRNDSDYAKNAYKNMAELEAQTFPTTLKEVVVSARKKAKGGQTNWLENYN